MNFERIRAGLEKLSSAVTWPFATLVIAGGLTFTAIVFYAPPEARELLLGANGLLATIVGYVLRSPRPCATCRLDA